MNEYLVLSKQTKFAAPSITLVCNCALLGSHSEMKEEGRRKKEEAGRYYYDCVEVESHCMRMPLYFLSPLNLKGTYDSSLTDALELEDQPHLWRKRSDQLATAPNRRLDVAHTGPSRICLDLLDTS